jgi:ATP-dependent Lhr-like helicase
MRGELRGGRLVGGFVGEQFAAPEAVEALRAVRRQAAQAKDGQVLPGEVVRLSACDPLNLVGVVTPGPRVAATLANTVTFRDGVPEAIFPEPTFAVQSAGVTYPAIAPAGSGLHDEL